MNIFEKILFRYKILKLDDQRIKHWIQKNQFEKIYFASKIGNFKIRLKILNEIRSLLENEIYLKIGIELINDKIKIVSEKSIEILGNQNIPNRGKEIKMLWYDLKRSNSNSKNQCTVKSGFKLMPTLYKIYA